MALPAIIMLDTNTASYIIREQHQATIRAHLDRVPINRLCISAICAAELRYGAARRPEVKKIGTAVAAFLKDIEILPWDSDAAEHYGHLRAQLDASGTPVGALDTLIAAHALSVSALLVTNDQAFCRIKGLKTVDWTKA